MTISEIVETQRNYYYTDITKPAAFRRDALLRLQKWLEGNEAFVFEALQKDLGKSGFESYMTEVGLVCEELRYTLRHLLRWVKPRRKRLPFSVFPAHGRILPEPYGVTLIMSPWNYPFQLTLNPLVGALAAGNCCVLKPSNYSPATSDLIAKMARECFDPAHVAVVLGGREQNSDLLKQEFDYIFFTGGATVGQLVLNSAATYLTPVTLELGGKSPCIVDKTANVQLAARRIAFGKFINAGQTCVAPDYVYVHESKKDALIRSMTDAIQEFYTSDPLSCAEYPRIVNRKHFDRLVGLLDGGKIAYGGRHDISSLKIMPTLLDEASWAMPVMRDEIFGPLLPILSYNDLNDVLHTIVAKPTPLALYLFTESREVKETVQRSVPFGGGCVNDTIVHIASPHLPFGGMGRSGMGQYHGKYTFDTFTHYKGMLEQSSIVDMPTRYMPGTPGKFRWVRRFMR